MKVVHSESTAVAKEPSSYKGAGSRLAGARCYQLEGFKVYVLMTVDKLSRLVEIPEEAIIGDFEDSIRALVEARHPCARNEATYLLPVKNYAVTTGKDGHYEVVSGWVIADRPLVECPVDKSQITAIAISLGPVLIYKVDFKQLFGDDAIAHGFTCRGRDIANHRLMQINYNPGSIRRSEYHTKEKLVKATMVPKFTADALWGLYKAIGPTRWPENCRLSGRDLMVHRGWNHIRRCSFNVGEIFQMYVYGKKLFPKQTWWRVASESPYDQFSFLENALKPALLNIHAVEKYARETLEQLKNQARRAYRRERAGYLRCTAAKEEILQTLTWESEGGGQLPTTTVAIDNYGEEVKIEMAQWPLTLHDLWNDWLLKDGSHAINHKYSEIVVNGKANEYIKSSVDARCQNCTFAKELWLCRFIRREAKIAGIPIPKPPRLPAKPKKPKSRKLVYARRQTRM